MVDPSVIYIDGTHIKVSSNKKKYQKEQVKKAAKAYTDQLLEEISKDRVCLGKKPIEGREEKVLKTVSTTDKYCGLFVKGEHEKQFAYEAHTACDDKGFVLGVEVTGGNVHDSVAWESVYDKVSKAHKVSHVAMDTGYKTPCICKKTIDSGTVPVLPYTRNKGKSDRYKPWEYTYDKERDEHICPQGAVLKHTTTDRDGKRVYRSTPSHCKDCPYKDKCGANEKG